MRGKGITYDTGFIRHAVGARGRVRRARRRLPRLTPLAATGWGQSWSAAACSAGVSGAGGSATTQEGANSFR